MEKTRRIRKIIYFSLLTLFVSLSACEKDAIIDLPEFEPSVVINCIFTHDEPFALHISKSKSILTGNTEAFSFIDNADVQICDGGQILEQITPPTQSGSDIAPRYLTQDLKASVGEIYTLKVEVEGVGLVTATSYIPEKVEIEHTAVGDVQLYPKDPETNLQGYNVKANVRFTDPPSINDFYQVSFYQELLIENPSSTGDSIKYLQRQTDFADFDEELVRIYNITDNGFLIKGSDFEGETKDFFFQPAFEYDVAVERPVRLVMELRTVSKEYYDYFSSLYRQKVQNGDPTNPAVEVISNIENGYGIFAGYSRDSRSAPISF